MRYIPVTIGEEAYSGEIMLLIGEVAFIACLSWEENVQLSLRREAERDASRLDS